MGRTELLYQTSPRQEIRRLEYIVQHLRQLSSPSYAYLAAFLLDTTQTELYRAGFTPRPEIGLDDER